MMHTIATAAFTVLFALWLTYETKRTVDFTRYLGLAIAGLVSPIIGSIAALAIGGQTGNFVLHAVGGGAASGFLFAYFIKTFGVHVIWRVEIALLFAFVSSLGVLNELAEYFIEVVFGIIMSVDTRDTWRDFVANTSGAFVVWLVYRAFTKIKAKND